MRSNIDAPRAGGASERSPVEHSFDRLQGIFLFDAGPKVLDALLKGTTPDAEQCDAAVRRLDEILEAMEGKARSAGEKEATSHARGYRLAITGILERMGKG